jgi:hypothetical protein
LTISLREVKDGNNREHGKQQSAAENVFLSLVCWQRHHNAPGWRYDNPAQNPKEAFSFLI